MKSTSSQAPIPLSATQSVRFIPFVKMHGLGNDFVVIAADFGDFQSAPLEINSDQARRICDRRFGIGADQILMLRKPHQGQADYRMEIWNADGGIAEMCGNGIRALALFLESEPGFSKTQESPGDPTFYKIETLAGIKTVEVLSDSTAQPGESGGSQKIVSVDMGSATLGGGFGRDGELIEVGGKGLRFFEVNVGNPHAVFFFPNIHQVPLEEIGPLIETHKRFPHRTNVEFVEVIGPNAILVRVWERGAGITLACGTGACASAVAALSLGKVADPVEVHLPGGVLKISWLGPDHPIFMTGPAVEVFRGFYPLS